MKDELFEVLKSIHDLKTKNNLIIKSCAHAHDDEPGHMVVAQMNEYQANQDLIVSKSKLALSVLEKEVESIKNDADNVFNLDFSVGLDYLQEIREELESNLGILSEAKTKQYNREASEDQLTACMATMSDETLEQLCLVLLTHTDEFLAKHFREMMQAMIN